MGQVQTKWPGSKEMSLDRQPSAGKDRRQHHGDSRAKLSGLEGHPVLPVVPGVRGMASLSGLVLSDGNSQPTVGQNSVLRHAGALSAEQCPQPHQVPPFCLWRTKGDLGS